SLSGAARSGFSCAAGGASATMRPLEREIDRMAMAAATMLAATTPTSHRRRADVRSECMANPPQALASTADPMVETALSLPEEVLHGEQAKDNLPPATHSSASTATVAGDLARERCG